MLSECLLEQGLFSITWISNLLSTAFIPVVVLRGRQRCWGIWGNRMRELGN